MKEKQVSEIDQLHLKIIRESVSSFLSKCGKEYDGQGFLLDIAPQDHEGAKPYFKRASIYTLDINPAANADFTADICQNNENIIPNSHFDWVVCTEVLEHTLNPFEAVEEIFRVLKPGGLLFLTTPFNFRIHGPLPDCWRFTEHGLKALLSKFTLLMLEEVETKDRDLMPIHYCVVARKES